MQKLSVIVAVFTAAHAWADPAVPSSRHLSAVRATSEIIIDGVLDERGWSTTGIGDFVQRDPDEGLPPTEATEVRVIYDDAAIYVAIRAFDTAAGSIGRRLSRRDENPDADTVQLYLDPLRDARSGVMFEVTAAGVQRDALIFNDSDFDFSWDAVWDSAVRIDERGWTAEIRIPFSQLRFPSGRGAAWGINVARYIRRRNETDWLALVPKPETRLSSRMAELTGLDAIRPMPRGEIASHVVARDLSADESPTPGALVGAVGFDVKYSPTSSATLEATVNPDFAQVESDPAVVNLTTFETFLEERRPFFTESAPLFQAFGNSGGAFDAPAPLLFYSRRIGQAPPANTAVGLLDQRTATPVIGALKVSGSPARYWKISFLDALTGATDAPATAGSAIDRVELAPTTNYAAGRVVRANDRGGVGLLSTAVLRDLQTEPADVSIPRQALVGGVDGYVFFDRNQDWVIGGQLSGSHLTWTPVSRSGTGATAGASTTLTTAAGWHVLSVRPSSNPHGPPSHPGGGPPTDHPGNGQPTDHPGNGPPSTIPGNGPPASAPAVGFRRLRGTPGGGVGRGDSFTENTGANRSVDLSLGRLDGWSANANLHRNNGAVRVNLDAWAISPGFETNDLGFLPRSDIQGVQGQVTLNKFDPDRFTRFRSVGVTKAWTRTFAGERQSDTVDVWANATFLNYWSAGGGVSGARPAFDAIVTRGGPSVPTPGTRSWWATFATDERRILSFGGGGSHAWSSDGSWSNSGWIEATLKPTSRITMSAGPVIERAEENAQYVTTIQTGASATPHYVFATLASSDVGVTGRLNVIATSRLSFQMYVQPFVATGRYRGFKELAGPANPFVPYLADIGFDPDFDPALFDLHAVGRWEWRRGSALYLVWTQRRAGSTGSRSAGVIDLPRAFDATATNAVAAKFTYWLGR